MTRPSAWLPRPRLAPWFNAFAQGRRGNLMDRGCSTPRRPPCCTPTRRTLPARARHKPEDQQPRPTRPIRSAPAEDKSRTVVVVDPRERPDDAWRRRIWVRPGTDAYLLLGGAAIVQNGLADEQPRRAHARLRRAPHRARRRRRRRDGRTRRNRFRRLVDREGLPRRSRPRSSTTSASSRRRSRRSSVSDPRAAVLTDSPAGRRLFFSETFVPRWSIRRWASPSARSPRVRRSARSATSRCSRRRAGAEESVDHPGLRADRRGAEHQLSS